MLEDRYRKREEKYTLLSKRISKAVTMAIRFKFALIAAAVIASIVCYKSDQYWIGGLALAVLLWGYIYMDIKHSRLMALRHTSELLARINADGLKRLSGQWSDFQDSGDDLIPSEHAYCEDIDILGPGSLFQWINMGATPWGRRALARALLFPLGSTAEIKSRQAAVEELAPLIGFRHRLKAESLGVNASDKEIQSLLTWAGNTQPLFRKRPVVALIRSLPVATILLVILGAAKIIPFFIPLTVLAFQASLLLVNLKNSKKLAAVYGCSHSLVRMQSVFGLIEKRRFRTPHLRALQDKMLNGQKDRPSKQIRSLSRLASSVSNRNYMFYIVINLFLLWDLQCAISMEKWRCESGRHLPRWFEAWGELEALSSLSLIKYDHPDWCLPSFQDSSSPKIIDAVQAGHPLIAQGCVCNDIQFTRDHPIVLVTGSNMSGKSTFLRTIGINLVLAFAGSSVFAETFSCQHLSLYTCMRVADNLQKNISSFYAEILRVKMIVDQVEKDRVFFLLDELFKGTNSADRHTAAKTIIHHLNQSGASGMVSTHDLDLEILENESAGKVRNFHFEESYRDNKIYFDYKLRRGISNTRNAIFLIKAAGLEGFDE